MRGIIRQLVLLVLFCVICTPVLLAQVPSVWNDGDIGTVGVSGSLSYASGTFTVQGAGAQIYGTADAFHFAYQQLSGDGSIVARLVSIQGGASYASAGVMIRETLAAESANVKPADWPSYCCVYLDVRATTGASTSEPAYLPMTLPYWVKAVRVGNSFTSYTSPDGIFWTQLGPSQTVSMAQDVYVGLAVTSGTTSALTTATFDNVSINSSANPAPVISSLSATTGYVGSQVVINGSAFGGTQNGSSVTLNDLPVMINTWSDTSLSVTIPSGATTGNLVVTVTPTMNRSNPVRFTVAPRPPTGWEDLDIGSVGQPGSGTYTSGTFTVTGAGFGAGTTTSDGINFLYQPLSGDGSIVTRLTGLLGSSSAAGVMIRETLSPDAKQVFLAGLPYSGSFYFSYANRSTTAASGSFSLLEVDPSPYWIKMTRTGDVFRMYTSSDGLHWNTSQTVTISMSTDVYVGLAVDSGTTVSTIAATFDNVSVSSAAAPAPRITSLSTTTASIGSQVLISGTGFGASQGSSVMNLNGTPVTVIGWSDTAVLVTIPTGATSGMFVAAIEPSMNCSNPIHFAVTSQPLTTGWLDIDVGATGLAGTATYSNGTFTVAGAGYGVVGRSSDLAHFVYQPLSGDGSIVARILSLTGPSSFTGVMIRESLDPAAKQVYAGAGAYSTSLNMTMSARSSDGATSTYEPNLVVPPPYWVKLTRSGSAFIGYSSPDGVNWTQMSSETVSMATNVYVGMTVSSGNVTALETSTFDNVSVSSTASPAPVISGVSGTTGSVGSQILITGTGFGSTQGTSVVKLNGTAVTINTWSDTGVLITIPAGATSGPLVLLVAPGMNSSNPVSFTVTSTPLPITWLDRDIGLGQRPGSATYSGGVYTVVGSGYGAVSQTNDMIHFVYQPLSGDGAIVARVTSLSGVSSGLGVMVRESLDAGARQAITFGWSYSSGTSLYLGYTSRPTPGTSGSWQPMALDAIPCWIKLVRSGSTFTSYVSTDGVNWGSGASQTVTMAQNVYIGLVLWSGNTSSTETATFDNVSITGGVMPLVLSVSPTSGAIGTSVTVNGASFGATQGTSTLTFHGAAATSISSWSNNQVVATLPAAATTGPVVVTVNSTPSNANVTFDVNHPVIDSLGPPAAIVGASVIVSGHGFGSNPFNTDVVKFSGVQAAILSWSDTSITASVPFTISSGLVTVTKGGVESDGVPFTVESGPPTITNLSPVHGVVGAWPVTITGTGFGSTQSNSRVKFWGSSVSAQVISWSDTSIEAVVPDDAVTGPITVRVAAIDAGGPWFNIESVAQLTDSLSNVTSYTSLMVSGQWTAEHSEGPGCSSCTIRGDQQNALDSNGNLMVFTDALGHTTSYTYDSDDNLASVSQPLDGGTTATMSYTYNSKGDVLTMTDPLGLVTTNTYDTHGNLTSVTTPVPNSTTAASVTQFGYDSHGQLTSITDPLNHATSIAYTSVGLIQNITDAQSHVTTYGYDARGNRTSVTDALNHTTSFVYDIMGRLTGITYPDNSTVSFTYDSRGRRTSVTDQLNHTTTYTYDDTDRLTAVTDAASHATQYAYDTENNLTSITDANSHTTSFAYNPRGWVTQTTFPSSHSETYDYDAIGNLTSKTDRKGQTITYVYDALNRMTQKIYPDTTSVEYVYDLVGKVMQVNDPTGTYGFAYDNKGRLIGTTTQYTFLSGQTFTNTYTYDAASNRTGMTAPDGSTSVYSYDTLNRLGSVTNSLTGSFGFSHDSLDRRTQLTRPNGVNTNYSYDSLSRLLSILHQAGGTTLDGATYAYDAAGNRTSKTDHLASVTSNFTYDAHNQLTQVAQGSATIESYSYDTVGNRLSSLGMALYNYDTSNQLTSTSNGSYTYDANGNTLTDPSGKSNSWDFENRLTQVTLPSSGGVVSFKYDAFGRRIQKISASGTTNYLYDGFNSLQEVDQSGTTLSRYTQGPGIDQPLAQVRSTTVSYYHSDGLGTITSLTDTAGVLVATYNYDGFGNLSTSTGSLTNPFRYAAREFDLETGLYYYRARYYDPKIGRFLGEDPIRFAGGINFYRYVRNNPVRLRDPWGLQDDAKEPEREPAGRGPNESGEEARDREILGDDAVELFEAIREAETREASEAKSWERTLNKLSPDEREAVENGACSVDPKVDEAVRLERFWRKLQGRAPVQSSPYNIIPKYDNQGNIRGWTTYDEFGNRAYRYEIETSRHGPGYHSFDNSETGGTGNGPESRHIPF